MGGIDDSLITNFILLYSDIVGFKRDNFNELFRIVFGEEKGFIIGEGKCCLFWYILRFLLVFFVMLRERSSVIILVFRWVQIVFWKYCRIVF